MKKLKKNWKKITLGIVVVFAGLVVLFGIGIFLWMQTWKNYEFPGTTISIRYPTNKSLVTGIVNNSQEQLSNEGSNENIFISFNSLSKSDVNNKSAEELATGFFQDNCSEYPHTTCTSNMDVVKKQNSTIYIVKIENIPYEDRFYVFTSYNNSIYELTLNIRNNNKTKTLIYKYISTTIINSIKFN